MSLAREKTGRQVTQISRAAVESYENDLIRQALDRTGWNKNRAANLLKLNRTTLVEMMKRKRIAPRAA
jgi:DNA-binding NtrC family response regulator